MRSRLTFATGRCSYAKLPVSTNFSRCSRNCPTGPRIGTRSRLPYDAIAWFLQTGAHTLTILVAATGIRISEAMGLKWEDVDYQNKQINLRRVWVKDTIVERLKTEDSEAPVPLTDLLAKYLRDWQRETVYGRPSDWVFASTQKKGKAPRSSSVLTWDHLRPAAIAAGVKLKKGQRFGFHNFRHGLASWLVNQGTDVKTVQGLLRHSNVKTTLGLYTHQVNSSMLAAQDSMMRALQPGSQTVQ